MRPSIRLPSSPTRCGAAAASRCSCFSPTGAANIARDGTADRAAALRDAAEAARALRVQGFRAMMIDISATPSDAARQLAGNMGATYLPLPHADASRISRSVIDRHEGRRDLGMIAYLDWARDGADWPNRDASRFVDAAGMRLACAGHGARALSSCSCTAPEPRRIRGATSCRSWPTASRWWRPICPATDSPADPPSLRAVAAGHGQRGRRSASQTRPHRRSAASGIQPARRSWCA